MASRRPDSDGADGIHGASGGPGARFLAGAAATFFFLLFGAEIGARYAAGAGVLYRKLDFSGTLSSLPELRDRIAWGASRPRPVFVLGDSVLGASALLEHRITHPRRQTVPAFLAQKAAPAGWSVESLGADGLLIPDLEAISREVCRAPPSRLVLVLNVRMFAREFGDPAKAISREFLLPALAGSLPDPRMAELAEPLDEGLSAASAEYSFLLRTARQLQPLWYYPTRRDFFRRLLEPARGTAGSADVEEAALRLKVEPYYRDRWDQSALAFRALGALLDGVRGRERTVVVLTPQNPDFTGDSETFAWNRRVLKDFIVSRADPSLEYWDFADRFPAERFLDHCHLTARGNNEYAEALLRPLSS